MTERPIPFSAEMVRAILDGRKTMTRRVIVPQPDGITQGTPWVYKDVEISTRDFRKEVIKNTYVRKLKCKYGVPGDLLWVREKIIRRKSDPIDVCIYAADMTPVLGGPIAYCNRSVWQWDNINPLVRSPRWASRILLEITAVRAERLQDITEGDAQKEGWFFQGHDLLQSYDPVTMDSARKWYSDLWDALNAKRGYPWSSNDWVNVIEFKRVSQ